MSDVRKILVMELWGMGDVVLMSAVLAPLRRAFPGAEITVLCQVHGRELLKENAEDARCVCFRSPWTAFEEKYHFWRWDWSGLNRIVTQFRRERFDLVLDGRGDPRNYLLALLFGARRVISLWRRDVRRHRLDHWAVVLAKAGVPAEHLTPVLRISEGERSRADAFLAQAFGERWREVVGIHPGAAHALRRWPLERYIEIGRRLKARGVPVLVFVSPDGEGEGLARALEAPQAAGAIRDLLALVSRLKHLVCNDTGVMHMAAAVGTPLTALFGPGAPDFIGPRPAGSIVIKPCAHRPCFDRCRKPAADCLTAVDVEDVWRELTKGLPLL